MSSEQLAADEDAVDEPTNDSTPSPYSYTTAEVADAAPDVADAAPDAADTAPDVADAAVEVTDAAPDAAPNVADAAPNVTDAAPDSFTAASTTDTPSTVAQESVAGDELGDVGNMSEDLSDLGSLERSPDPSRTCSIDVGLMRVVQLEEGLFQSHCRRLQDFYSLFAPEEIPNVQDQIHSCHGKEEEFFEDLKHKYQAQIDKTMSAVRATTARESGEAKRREVASARARASTEDLLQDVDTHLMGLKSLSKRESDRETKLFFLQKKVYAQRARIDELKTEYRKKHRALKRSEKARSQTKFQLQQLLKQKDDQIYNLELATREKQSLIDNLQILLSARDQADGDSSLVLASQTVQKQLQAQNSAVRQEVTHTPLSSRSAAVQTIVSIRSHELMHETTAQLEERRSLARIQKKRAEKLQRQAAARREREERAARAKEQRLADEAKRNIARAQNRRSQQKNNANPFGDDDDDEKSGNPFGSDDDAGEGNPFDDAKDDLRKDVVSDTASGPQQDNAHPNEQTIVRAEDVVDESTGPRFLRCHPTTSPSGAGLGRSSLQTEDEGTGVNFRVVVSEYYRQVRGHLLMALCCHETHQSSLLFLSRRNSVLSWMLWAC